MWGSAESVPDSSDDKGGDDSTGSSCNRELIDLKDQFEQQQLLIAQLKEMLRKTEQKNVSDEKVEEYANTLTRMSVRAKKNRSKRGEPSDMSATDTPASEKIMLLRQQLEENKLRLAQRGKFQKGIEETVTQLKAQLDDSQQLISQTPLNLSLIDVKNESYSSESSPDELFNLLVNKDKRLSELHNKIQKLEANVIDLQENLKEKDSVIDARTKAITLMTESLSKKGKNTLDALDDTKEQMREMQANFITLEMGMKTEKEALVNQLAEKNLIITELQEANDSLQNDNKKLQNEIEVHKEYSISEETEHLMNRLRLLENELSQKTTDIEHYTNKLTEKDHEVLQIRQECDDLRNEIDVLKRDKNENKIQVLISRVAELEELNLELTKSASETTSSRESPQRFKKGKKGSKLLAKPKDSVELQKLLDKAKEESEQYRERIAECDVTMQELNLIIAELKSKEKVKEESDDAIKLKKQLDESNKNMIKIKAQHKSKIKELHKKIDELKNGEEHQEENSQLKERIDILEKQSAQLILNSVEDAATKERMKELESQLFEQSELLDAKNQSLDTLEAQLKSYKTELTSLSERFNKLSNVENDQVASEMTSIHFEEQLDNLNLEKKLLDEKNQMLVLEKQSLLEKIETILKEKQEITTKLECYMQENMDLIDKLEKLSAEKVSSAESIEIVESLTQQEKLELEAYQQSLELVSGNINENLQNPELNESVNQLTEETCDLLQKIELFTEERREVMEKMEALNAENNQLNVKIQEIENNREILSETYEQLQNEKEVIEQERNTLKLLEIDLNNEVNLMKKENDLLRQQIKQDDGEQTFETLVPPENNDQKSKELQKQIDEYKSLIEIQKSEIKELKEELLSHKDLPAANKELHDNMTTLQEQYANLIAENEKLNKVLKEQNEIKQEKEDLEHELGTVKKRILDFNIKLEENYNELENYKLIIEENKQELISSSNIITTLQEKVQWGQNEITHYQNEISNLNSIIMDLNGALSHLENENQNEYCNTVTVETLSTELEDLKMLLNENISQIEVYQQELQENSLMIGKLNAQLKELNGKLLDTEHELDCKDDEIRKLCKERDNKELMIKNIQTELHNKEEHFQNVCSTLNTKYLVLQAQFEENAEALNKLSRIEELEKRNKEQLDKMKIIAANLKKKTAAYLELDQRHKDLNQKFREHESDRLQLNEKLEMYESKIESLLETERAQSHDVTMLTKEVTNLRTNCDELQQQIEMQLNLARTEAELLNSNESNRLNEEINEKNEIIKNLHQQLEDTQYNFETSSNALYVKIKQMEMFVETQEIEINTYKEKIYNLEEIVSTGEERRLSLERKTMELGEQLLEKSDSYEKISKTEDMLEQRLAALIQHEAGVEKRLTESLGQNQELLEHNQTLMETNEQLQHHLSAATEKNISFSVTLEQKVELENDLLKQREIINDLEMQNKNMHADFDKKLKKKEDEIETLENELQSQLQQVEDERRGLIVQCEHLQDQLKDYTEKQILLYNEIELYKEKLDQQQADFDAQMKDFENLNEENKKNLGMIEQYSIDWESLKNDNEKLQSLLNLRSEEIVELKKLKEESEMEVKDSTLKRLPESSTLGLFDKSETISTFVWPNNTSSDPFDFVSEPEVIEVPILVTNEPLVNSPSLINNDSLFEKIKTLEFMVYNTEKEKEDVLLQCQELTNQIARLIYEKQSDPQDSVKLESTVCCKCNAAIEHDEVDSQIIPIEETVVTHSDLAQLQKLEFADIKSSNVVTNIEDPFVSKTAYLCHTNPHTIPEDEVQLTKVINLQTFDENKDGWDYGEDEVKLEDNYRQGMGDIASNTSFNIHIEELNEKVKVLELERERHIEEIKQLQIKSGKLIKKLKELKVTNEKLQATLKKSDFGDLDNALQGELISQIEQLEKRIKESNLELQREKTEKGNLLQKVNALQTTNERLAEGKEKQEVDFMVLQRQNQELATKLNQFEWGNEDFDSPARKEIKMSDTHIPVDLKKTVQELNDTIRDLTFDNEELQMLLEEQRVLRINAEKIKIMEPIKDNMRSEAEYMEVLTEKNSLNDQLIMTLKEKKMLQEELNKITKANEELQYTANNLTEEKLVLQNQLSESCSKLQVQKEALERQGFLSDELDSSKQKLYELNDRLVDLENFSSKLQQENDALKEVENSFICLNEENERLCSQLQTKNLETINFATTIKANEEQIFKMQNLLRQSQDEKEKLLEQLTIKDKDSSEHLIKLNEAAIERESYSASLQQLANEWSKRVDERGLDVAENWKLHLEAKETEFAQIQKQLYNDIRDLEEKCNGLVNENNELRKNVDAEIRNEVDKISALQQQINNRQLCINELTSTLEENQTLLQEQQRLTNEYKSNISQANQQLEEKHLKVMELNKLTNDLTTEVASNKAVITSLSEKVNLMESMQKELGECRELSGRLQQELDEKQRMIIDFNENFAEEINNKSMTIDQLTERINEVEQQKHVSFNKIQDLENKIQVLNIELQEKITMTNFLHDQIQQCAAKNATVENLAINVDHLNALIDDKQREIDEALVHRQIQDDKIMELTFEINQLKLCLEEKEKEHAYQLEAISQQGLQSKTDLMNSYAKTMLTKDSELEALHMQLQEEVQGQEVANTIIEEREVEISGLKAQLDLKTTECNELSNKLFEEETLHKEEDKQISELSQIIQEQVLKIERFKQELFEKSKDYDSLIAELDLRKPSSEQHRLHQQPIKELDLTPVGSVTEDSSDPRLISHPELDLALYMLHQRDVRCEELTVELIQLLEERDTLQLKLSNAIREKEELRRKFVPELVSESISEELPNVFPVKLPQNIAESEMQETSSESTVADRLSNKLSELKSVGYKKDKTLLDEQEHRRLMQLTLMQQHRDVASMLPPEAAARLVQEASYTLSRDVQSPSKVLLNWLWGRSTPKVNDI
ncbi:hypothetical protein FQA39_LY18043 [Lamprigera yunnana]|nr:hypothetical protein FQA39_LY18043 [Lamprigera yunnana]